MNLLAGSRQAQQRLLRRWICTNIVVVLRNFVQL